MKVRILQSTRADVAGEAMMLEGGKTYDLPEALVRALVKKGVGLEEKSAEAEPKEEEPEGVDIEDFTKKSRSEGALWIRTSELNEGDEFEVLGAGYVDNETFDKPYLCIPVLYKGLEKKLRLGVQNVERIAKKLGKNSALWVGKKIVVTAMEDCPGLGKEKRRAILDGVP